jgi:hypothetical protein
VNSFEKSFDSDNLFFYSSSLERGDHKEFYTSSKLGQEVSSKFYNISREGNSAHVLTKHSRIQEYWLQIKLMLLLQSDSISGKEKRMTPDSPKGSVTELTRIIVNLV